MNMSAVSLSDGSPAVLLKWIVHTKKCNNPSIGIFQQVIEVVSKFIGAHKMNHCRLVTFIK